MRAGAEPYPGTPDRHRASQSSQTDAPSPSTRQPRLPGPPVCERILTQPQSSHTEPAKPARRNGIARVNPHKSAFGTIIGKSAHAPTYATRHNGHPTTADHANQHQSILTTNAGAISRRHQLISTTIPFGASLWNTLRYTSRRIYTLHVFTVRWSFHGRTIRK